MSSVFFAPWRQPIMQPPQECSPARSGPSPPKYGSGTVTPGSPKKTATSVGCELVHEAEVPPDVAQDLVRRRRERHARRAEHPLRGRVVGLELRLPVGERRPGRRREERVARHRQRVRVDERAAAHADARERRDVPQERHLEEAAEADAGEPQPLREVPVGLREVLGGEARPLLEHEDALALLREAQRRDAPAEAGADDREVRVEIARHRASLAPGREGEIRSLLRVDGAAKGGAAGDFFE